MQRCEHCQARLPRKRERCDGCGAVNPRHSAKASPAGLLRVVTQAVSDFKTRHPNTWQSIAVLFVGGVLLIAFGIGIANVIASAGAFFVIAGLFIICVGAWISYKSENRQQLMHSLGVDAAAHAAYERERGDKPRARSFGYGSVVVTEHWLWHDSWLYGPLLLPLNEIMGFTKEHSSGRYGSSFSVRLRLKENRSHVLPCDFNQLDQLMALLAERCPQAKQ